MTKIRARRCLASELVQRVARAGLNEGPLVGLEH